MGTSNFHYVNASKVFAVELEDEWAYDDLCQNLKGELENVAKVNKNISFWKGGTDSAELRSFPSHVLGTLYASRSYMVDGEELTMEVNVVAVARSGYYSGCNLDYVYNFGIEGRVIESLDEVVDVLENYCSREMAVYKSSFIEKFLDKSLDAIVEKMEEMFAQYSEKLDVVATFSNGETIYRKSED